MGCRWISALVPWSSFSPSFFTELGAHRAVSFTSFSSLLAFVQDFLPFFTYVSPNDALAMAQPRPAVGGWIRRDPVGSGWSSPSLPSQSPRSSHCCCGLGIHTPDSHMHKLFLQHNIPSLSYFTVLWWLFFILKLIKEKTWVNFLSGAPQSTEAMQPWKTNAAFGQSRTVPRGGKEVLV